MDDRQRTPDSVVRRVGGEKAKVARTVPIQQFGGLVQESDDPGAKAGLCTVMKDFLRYRRKGGR